MYTRVAWRRQTALLVFSLGLLAACGDDVGTLLRSTTTTTPPGSHELGDDGKVFLLGVSALSGITEFQKLLDFRSSAPLRLISLRDHVWTYAFGANGTCNPTASNTNDADGNGVLDDAIVTFTAQTCVLIESGANAPVTGTMRVQDLGGLYGIRLTFNSVRITTTNADTVGSITLDGVAELRVTGTGASSVNTVTTTIAGNAPGASTTLVFANDLATHFAPMGTITKTQNLPAGNFTVSGTTSFTATATGKSVLPAALGTGVYTMEVSTPVPLHYDGTCSAANNFFSGGSMHLMIQGVAGAEVTTNWPTCSSTPPTPQPPTKK